MRRIRFLGGLLCAASRAARRYMRQCAAGLGIRARGVPLLRQIAGADRQSPEALRPLSERGLLLGGMPARRLERAQESMRQAGAAERLGSSAKQYHGDIDTGNSQVVIATRLLISDLL